MEREENQTSTNQLHRYIFFIVKKCNKGKSCIYEYDIKTLLKPLGDANKIKTTNKNYQIIFFQSFFSFKTQNE